MDSHVVLSTPYSSRISLPYYVTVYHILYFVPCNTFPCSFNLPSNLSHLFCTWAVRNRVFRMLELFTFRHTQHWRTLVSKNVVEKSCMGMPLIRASLNVYVENSERTAAYVQSTTHLFSYGSGTLALNKVEKRPGIFISLSTFVCDQASHMGARSGSHVFNSV